MSIEGPNIEKVSPFSQEDIDTAQELVNTDETLKNDSFARKVVENEGLLETGEYVADLGQWLADRKEAIESGQTSAVFEANANNKVIHSEKPDKEIEE